MFQHSKRNFLSPRGQVVVFARKHDIFTCENNMLHTPEISPLLWLRDKTRLSQQKTIKVKWFGISFAALAREIFFNT